MEKKTDAIVRLEPARNWIIGSLVYGLMFACLEKPTFIPNDLVVLALGTPCSLKVVRVCT